MGDSVDADIVAEYERLLALEEDRRRKRDTLEALLPTIADALDVRVVVTRMSAQIQDVIPHVTVVLALLTPDRGGVKIHVASNYDVGDLPVYRFTIEGKRFARAGAPSSPTTVRSWKKACFWREQGRVTKG
jgi:hypothetical protein